MTEWKDSGMSRPVFSLDSRQARHLRLLVARVIAEGDWLGQPLHALEKWLARNDGTGLDLHLHTTEETS